MSRPTRTVAALIAVIFGLQAIGFAAFGPCAEDLPSSQTNTIGCLPTYTYVLGVPVFSGYRCFGSLTNFPQQKSCQSTNESACTDLPAPFSITYGNTGSTGWTEAGCNAGCAQDLTKKTTTPGGTNC